MAGFFPQALVHHRRGAHFLVAVIDELLPHVLLDLLPHDPALGVPEHHARRLLLHVQQVELLRQFSVVALLGLFQAVQVSLEIFLLRPRRAVDALQHRVLRVAAPVGAGQLHQLERARELARGRQVRAAADVEPVALAINRKLLAGRNHIVDDLHLVGLAQRGERALGVLALPHLALDRQVALDDLVHALLDLFQVFRRKGDFAREIVIETVLDRRADRHLRARIQFLHRLRHHMRGVVAQQFQRVLVLAGDDRQIRIAVDDIRGVDHAPVDLAGQGGLGQARTDGGGDILNADGLIETALTAVGKGDGRHVVISSGGLYEGPHVCVRPKRTRDRRASVPWQYMASPRGVEPLSPP